MNRRKNTKSIWSKFSSPTNHSVANLLIDPPASSTTKLLRGNRTGGCDNHSFYAATAAIIPAAARTASAHGSTSAHSTQQIYGASNIVAGRTSPSTLTGTSAAALSFAAMEQMQMQNKLYSA